MRTALPLLATLALAAPASAATTVGANLAIGNAGGRHNCTDQFPGVISCTSVVTAHEDGSSAAVPVSGVLVSASLRVDSPVGSLHGRIRVLHDPGGQPTHDGSEPVVFAGTSDPITLATDGAVHSFPVRLKVSAGDLIGWSSGEGFVMRAQTCPAVCERIYEDSADGTTTTVEAWLAPNYQAPIAGVVEPDADSDGYGDETQDLCATDGATHDACPPSGGTGGGGGDGGGGSPQAPTVDTVAPVLSPITLTRKTFRVDRRAAAAKVKRGTALSFTVSEPGTATLGVFKLSKKGKASPVTELKKAVVAGKNRIAFPGRVHVGSLVKTLAAGRYRLTLVVADAAGNRSNKVSAKLRIVR